MRAVFLNPMASLVEAFKCGLLGIGELNLRALASSAVVIAPTLAGGIWYVSRTEGASIDEM